MSCASRTDRLSGHVRSRGLTLVEIMVVAMIVLVFSASAAMVFIQLIQTSDEVDSRIEAIKNGRFFLDTLSEDLKQASLSATIPRFQLFRGDQVTFPYGDLFDNDGDGVVDEEAPDAIDNDGDWVLADDDNEFSTVLSTSGAGGLPPLLQVAERGLQEPDLGDGHVDEDVVFNSDQLSFWVRGPLSSNIARRRLTFRIQNFDGEDNVAVRIAHTEFNDGTPAVDDVGPLAFGVVGLNFLYWDHRTTPPQWQQIWNSGLIASNEVAAPVSVYAEITVHSASTGLRLPPTRPLSTARLATIIDLEAVLRSPGFPRGEDRPEGSPLTSVAGASDLSPAGSGGLPSPNQTTAAALPAPGEPRGL